MHLRGRRTWAAIAALALTTPAFVALSSAPASAGTTTGMITCSPPSASPAGTPDAPFVISYTADPPPTVAPGAAYALTGTLAVTVPGAVVGGFVVQANATSIAFIGGAFNLSATNTSGTFSTGNVGARPAQPITNYDAATQTADDITFTFPNVTYSGATAGAHGGTINASLSANQTGAGLALQLAGAIPLSLGFGTNSYGAAIGSTGTCAATAASYPSLGTTSIVDATPVVTAAASYGGVADIANTFSVTASDGGGAGIQAGSWAISSGPTCTGSGGNGTASISGTASGATVTFNAPGNAATCTIGVTVSDGVTTSTEAVLNINVVAGDSLQQDVTQVVNPGALDLLACGSTAPDPAACSITMSEITLNGSEQSTTGDINQVTVQDARGLPLGWSLTAALDGDLTNSNASLTGPNASIPADLLTITPSCAAAPGNANAAPTVGGAGQSLGAEAALCSTAAGSNTGSFLVDGELDLTVPSTVYAGTYTGTINFIVS